MDGTIFRVFVSSTFADLVDERNALQDRVWPKLDELCRRHGYTFEAIDLRWGVSDEATFDHQAVQVCLQEIERCQQASPRLNFLVLMGDRYGWRPLPPAIEAAEFATIRTRARALALPHRDLLEQWYRRDDNAVPAAYVLRPRDVGYRADEVWRTRVETPLRTLLGACLASDAPDRDRYERSVTELEITAGALDRPPGSTVFAYLREIRRPLGGWWRRRVDPGPFVERTATGKVDEVAGRLREHLKARLVRAVGGGRVRRYAAEWDGYRLTDRHIDELCADVLRDLSGVIEAEIAATSAIDGQTRQEDAHRRYGRSRAPYGFVGRTAQRARVADYLRREGPARPFVLAGPTGSGKSALLAETARQAAAGGWLVVERYVGATSESRDGRFLLRGLCAQLGRLVGDPDEVPESATDAAAQFHARLVRLAERQRVVVVVDAVDTAAATGDEWSLGWLGPDLPPDVRLIVSVADHAVGLLPRSPADDELLALDDYLVEDAGALLDAVLLAAGRTVTWAQRAAVLAAFATCPRPIVIVLSAELARHWRSDEPNVALPAAGSADDQLAAIADQSFAWLAEPARHGRELVDRVLALLASARYGLAEDEIQGLLSRDYAFIRALDRGAPASSKLPAFARLPTVLWARLYADLRPYLTEQQAAGSVVLGFGHASIRAAAARRAMTTAAQEYDVHHRMADYFRPQRFGFARNIYEGAYGSMWFSLGLTSEFFDAEMFDHRAWPDASAGPRPVHRRAASEVPYQLIRAAVGSGASSAWDEVADLLTNLYFLEARAEGGDLAELHDDLHTAVAHLPAEHPRARAVRAVRVAIDRHHRFLTRHPTLLFQCLYNTIAWADSPEPPNAAAAGKAGKPGELTQLADRWRTLKRRLQPQFTWARALRPPIHPVDGALVRDARIQQRLAFGLAASADGAVVACIGVDTSPDRAGINVWLPETGLLHVTEEPATTYGLAVDPNGARLAAVENDHLILHTIDRRTGGLEEYARVSAGPSLCRVAWSLCGRWIATGSRDGWVRVHAADTGAPHWERQGHGKAAFSLAWSDDHLVSGAEDVILWEADDGTEVRRLGGLTEPVLSVAVHGTMVAAAMGAQDIERLGRTDPDLGRQIVVWDVATGERLATLRGHQDAINAIAFTGAGRLVSVSGDLLTSTENAIFVWDVTNGERIARIGGQPASVEGVVAHSGGTRLVTMGGDGLLQDWDADALVRARALDGHTEQIRIARFSPNGRWVVTSSWEDPPRIWDAETGRTVRILHGHEAVVRAIGFSPDSRRVVTGAGRKYRIEPTDYTARVWDLHDQDVEHVLTHDWPVTLATYSADGRYLITGVSDPASTVSRLQTLHAWDARTFEHLWQVGESAPIYLSSLVSGSDPRELMRGLAEQGTELPTPPEPVLTATGRDEESVITDPASGRALGWIPETGSTDPHTLTPYALHPHEPAFAVVSGPNLHLYRLEQV